MDILNVLTQPGDNNPIAIALILLITVWTVFWKGLALWNAALNDQRNWFVALIIVNTVGILEIIYLFRFAKKRYTLKKVLEIVKNPKI